MLYLEQRNVSGLDQLLYNRRLLTYLPRLEFATVSRCQQIMLDLWQSYTYATQDYLISPQLQQSLVSAASRELPDGTLAFYDRALTILSAGLNISWQDLLTLRWGIVINAAQISSPQAFLPHADGLRIFSEVSYQDYGGKEITTLPTGDKTVSLARRLHEVLLHLDAQRQQGTLGAAVEKIRRGVTPASPALLKAVAKHHTLIEQLDEPAVISA